MGASTTRALQIVREYGRDHLPDYMAFAERMWPDSPGWTRSKQQGTRGSTQGLGMARAANGLLGRMAKQGLIDISRDPVTNRLTIWLERAGEQVLEVA